MPNESVARFRRATLHDLTVIAEQRWDFRAEDGERPIVGRDEFVQRFVEEIAPEVASGRVTYWIAESGSEVIAQMALVRVNGIPRPSRASDQWGYLTDCYTRPTHRGQGVGTKLLAHVRAWGEGEDLELLLVSPSEEAESFYARAGFTEAMTFRQLILRDFDAGA